MREKSEQMNAPFFEQTFGAVHLYIGDVVIVLSSMIMSCVLVSTGFRLHLQQNDLDEIYTLIIFTQY